MYILYGDKQSVSFSKKNAVKKFGFLKKLKRTVLVSAYYDRPVMSLKYSDGSIRKYKGSGTVWYSYPMMKRCGTNQEYFLTQVKEYIDTHGNPYPTAHKTAKNQ